MSIEDSFTTVKSQTFKINYFNIYLRINIQAALMKEAMPRC